MQKLNYLGVPIYMNGRNYYVPSLGYADLKANYDLLTTPAPAEGAGFFSFVDKVIPVIGAALRRNYPEMSDADLAQWIDGNTLPLLLKACAGQSGLTAVSEGE